MQEYKKQTLELIKNFDHLKQYCQEEFKLWNERSKMYIPPGVLKLVKFIGVWRNHWRVQAVSTRGSKLSLGLNDGIQVRRAKSYNI